MYIRIITNIYINIKLINIRLKSNTFMENILDIEYMTNSEGYNYLYIEIDKLSKIQKFLFKISYIIFHSLEIMKKINY